MSDLNVSILQQAVENFNNQYQKNAACTENDQVSLQRASALLDGLKGMFSLDDFNVKISGNMFCVATSFDGYVLELSLDPNFDLKLRNVKVLKDGVSLDASDILAVCSVLDQPTDIRQAVYLARTKFTADQ